MYSSSNVHFKKRETKKSSGGRGANNDTFDPFELDYGASEDSIELTRDQENGATPVVSRAKDFTFEEDDYPSEGDSEFEPFHDRQTNRTIMRMRMGSLIDHEGVQDEESFQLHKDKEDDEKPMWKLFEESAFENFKRASTFFQTNDKEEDTFDQVSFTDPYNAWDVLPSFLSNPYDMLSTKKKKSPMSQKSPPRINKSRKTTVIDKDGWPRASAPKPSRQSKMAFLPNTFVSTSSSTTTSTTEAPSSDDIFEVPIDEKNVNIPDDEEEAKLPVEGKKAELREDEKKEELPQEDDERKEDILPSVSKASVSKWRKKRVGRMRDQFREKRATINESFETLEELSDEATTTTAKSAGQSSSQGKSERYQVQELSVGMGNSKIFEPDPETNQAEPLSNVHVENLRKNFERAEQPSITSTVTSRETGDYDTEEPDLQEILEKYKVLIENEGKSLADIKILVQEDSQLSKREGEAFLLGLDLAMSATANLPNQNQPKRERKALTKDSPKSSSDAATTVSSSSFASPRMKARASSRSITFNKDVSNLMVSTLLSKQSPRVRGDDDAKTTVSGMTTLSCRELSIQRLKRRMATTRAKEQREVSELLKDLEEAQSRQKRLEQQLNQAGITIAEDIPYAEAKAQVAKIADQMQAIGHSQATHPDPSIQIKLRSEYFVLEQQMEKYMRALELTDEYLKEQERLEAAFDNDNAEENADALQQVWKHMPVDIRQKSVDEWLETRSPSGKYLPKEFLIKFSRTNILTLLRMNPDFILRAHPSNLEQRRVTGLTLTERRALHSFLKPIAQQWRNSKAPSTKRKWNWYCILRQTFKDHLVAYQHHVAQHGQLEDGSCPCGGLKCPVRSNRKLDYFKSDYGYPCSVLYPEYEQNEAASTSMPKEPKTTKPKQDTMKPRPDSTRKSFLSDIAGAAPKMRAQRKSSLMEEIAQRASKRNLAK